MPAEPGDLDVLAAGLAKPVDRILGELTELRDLLERIAMAAAESGSRVAMADLVPVRAVADRTLAADRLLVGAGVVLEPGYLADADRYLEWRQVGPDGKPRPLLLDVDPASEDPYDYPEMEWFRIPRSERRRMVGGPYFDYRGADRFALTFAVPVVAAGEFVGVAGADVPLSLLESVLLPVLRRIGQRAALLNHEARVVTANTPFYVTGARVRPAAGEPVRTVEVLPDLGWTLLISEQ